MVVIILASFLKLIVNTHYLENKQNSFPQNFVRTIASAEMPHRTSDIILFRT